MDIVRMRKSFEAVAAHGDEVPLWFYSHLFLSHPETRAMFPVSMAQQRDRLFGALGHIVTKVDDSEALVPYLQQLGRDHRKFGTQTAHYPAVGASLLATLAHFAGPDWTPEVEADWTAAYGLVAGVMSGAADAAADAPASWDADVVAHELRTPEIAVVRLRPREPYPFSPGQALTLETERRPRLWRTYSIANAPREDGTLDLHVQAMDGGPVSLALVRHLEAGDVVRLGPPLGTMTLDPDSERDLLLVGSGTGFAPLKAMIEQIAGSAVPRRVDLFLGVGSGREFYDLDDLQRLQQEHGWLSVVLAATRPDPLEDRTGVEEGHVTDVVVRRGPWPGRDGYVCGSSEMVGSTVARLVDAHVPRHRIRSEVFLPSRPAPTTTPTTTGDPA
ncbi:NAD(P)H-flavin reductase [Motilibacter rhizosphaerae]|uniref:nitric oxide dioxygenase n=1 Tax=Motilibacter rhizosphaerae TaxID=598652 RepID=A0A4Q7NG42_9ACTN|nr:globin domain-containing protein [Motilibacter rhizosphaerae]RZS82785.1 NAD(P)H-flavin reductase [Motilibacter rhizosphaerae]